MSSSYAAVTSRRASSRNIPKKQYERGVEDGRAGRRISSFTRSYLQGYVRGRRERFSSTE